MGIAGAQLLMNKSCKSKITVKIPVISHQKNVLIHTFL